MKVLLSIKPEFVNEMVLGNKKFEYRKSIFKRADVTDVVVYATKPYGKVVGEFKIDRIIDDNPSNIWQRTKNFLVQLKISFTIILVIVKEVLQLLFQSLNLMKSHLNWVLLI